MKTKLIQSLQDIKGSQESQMQAISSILCQHEIFSKCKDFNQHNPHHCYTLLDHIIVTYLEAKDMGMDENGLIAALFHDVGKPDTLAFKEGTGIATYHRHSKASCKLFKAWVADNPEWINLSEKAIREVAYLISHHEFQMLNTRTWRKYLSETSSHTINSLLDLRTCDILAQAEEGREEKLIQLENNARAVESILQEQHNAFKLVIKGGDLIQIGIQPGPGIGKILNTLTELVKGGSLHNTKEELLKYAKEVLLQTEVKGF